MFDDLELTGLLKLFISGAHSAKCQEHKYPMPQSSLHSSDLRGAKSSVLINYHDVCINRNTRPAAPPTSASRRRDDDKKEFLLADSND